MPSPPSSTTPTATATSTAQTSPRTSRASTTAAADAAADPSALSSSSSAASASASTSADPAGPDYRDPNNIATPDSSSSSVIGDDPSRTPNTALQRPKMGTRKSSGTIIVPREHPRVELKEGDEVFDADDARAMSPRRSSRDLEKMGQEARAQLNEHAKVLQESLLEIFNRIEAVKSEHDKLDNNNKFLQKYIGDLMSTSKITSTGSSGRKK